MIGKEAINRIELFKFRIDVQDPSLQVEVGATELEVLLRTLQGPSQLLIIRVARLSIRILAQV